MALNWRDRIAEPDVLSALRRSRAYTTNLLSYPEYPLLHFFLFLVKTMDRFPPYRVDIAKYFSC